jgi:hypothetical protein
MSKDLARGSESYENERLAMAAAPIVLRARGFQAVRMLRPGGMKIAEATRVDGTPVVFWLEQAWSTTSAYSAIQFGMLPSAPPPKTLPDDAFVDFVEDRIKAARERGATHALLVHLFGEKIQGYVALHIDDLVQAYARQIAMSPARARNTKTPTLYFGDARRGADTGFIRAVTDLDIRLEDLSGLSAEADTDLGEPASRKVTAEIERRVGQEAFRIRVGERCGWRCVVTGVTIADVLDAAHLPGRNWRLHNEAADGILLRADLHRLLDRQLAKIESGRFLIAKSARVGEYAMYHRRPIAS